MELTFARAKSESIKEIIETNGPMMHQPEFFLNRREKEREREMAVNISICLLFGEVQIDN